MTVPFQATGFWRRRERPARAGVCGVGDRGARVPPRGPGVLLQVDRRRRGLHRLRGGHFDRDDRPLHRVRDPDLPAAAARKELGAGRVDARPRYKPIGIVACTWILFISVLFILPITPTGIPFKDGFTWLSCQLRAGCGPRDVPARRRVVARIRAQVVQGTDCARDRGRARADRGEFNRTSVSTFLLRTRRRINRVVDLGGSRSAGSLRLKEVPC